jgi:hypothetical protein
MPVSQGENMNKAVMAALLLGMVVGVPARVSAVEETISAPREQGILNEASLLSSLEGVLAGIISGGGGAISMVFSMLGGFLLMFAGFFLTPCLIGIPMLCIGGLVLTLGILLGMCGIWCAVPVCIVTSIITLPSSLIKSIESLPSRIINQITWNLKRLRNACLTI